MVFAYAEKACIIVESAQYGGLPYGIAVRNVLPYHRQAFFCDIMINRYIKFFVKSVGKSGL